MSRKSFALLAVAFLVFSGSLLGQNGPDSDPDGAQGYVNNAFHHSRIDSVNLYNGQLTVPIDVGPGYPVGPSLRFQAHLIYNSKVMDYGRPGKNTGDLVTFRYEPVSGDPALAIGWNFNFGAIKSCYLGRLGAIDQFFPCFVGSDGSQHIFDLGTKSGDGSPFRLQGTGPYQMWDGDGNRYDFTWQVAGFNDSIPVQNADSGYIRDFGWGRDGWYVTSVTDPFGNSYIVNYFDTAADSVVFPCWGYDAWRAPTARREIRPATFRPECAVLQPDRRRKPGSRSW